MRPRTGTSPVTSSYSTTPSPYTSTFSVTRSPSSTSGACTPPLHMSGHTTHFGQQLRASRLRMRKQQAQVPSLGVRGS